MHDTNKMITNEPCFGMGELLAEVKRPDHPSYRRVGKYQPPSGNSAEKRSRAGPGPGPGGWGQIITLDNNLGRGSVISSCG